MAPSHAEARILRGLSGRMPGPEARRVLRRGRRIALLLDGPHPDDKVLAFVCDALAREGGLVQELVEEFAARLATRPDPHPKGTPEPALRRARPASGARPKGNSR